MKVRLLIFFLLVSLSIQAAPIGNEDGIADRLQPHALPSQVMITTDPGLCLVNAGVIDPSSLNAAPPAGFSLPVGLVHFRLEGLPTPGASVTVTQVFRADFPAGTVYYNYGSPGPGLPPVYYNFTYGGHGGLGAEIVGNKIILHLKDGCALGDDDDTENAVISNSGGPAVPAQISLSISRVSSGQVRLFWPSGNEGLVLQTTDRLDPAATWADDTNPVVTNGGFKSVTAPLADAQRFYRLGPLTP